MCDGMKSRISLCPWRRAQESFVAVITWATVGPSVLAGGVMRGIEIGLLLEEKKVRGESVGNPCETSFSGAG
ncbi:hypothetical protein GGP41_009782 [Bipolaris sorokiniana]|uniref:Uncharacterized protein n=1 Tax=Cochliobolus sativus TaxID=45130 RepID=A0A8H6DUS6_COCSA|nr:hypothetical protein GGP41_009782 [Bipolaris sorokiniana]